MTTLIESNGTVSLYRNTDGTFSASQGGVSTLIKDYGNPPMPTTISNIVAADYLNGVRIVVFGGGHTWYVDSNWQKAPVGPGGADTINLTPEQLNAVLSGGSPIVPVVPVLPTYAISAVTAFAAEGGTAVFNVVTTLLPEGTLLNYTLSGNISAADIVGGNLNGSVRIDAGGRGVINIGIANDALVEGPENFTIRLDINGSAVGQVINDVQPTGPLTRTLMESNGTVSLYRNSDGTFSAVEGGNSTLIKDYGNPPTPTTISNIVAADYLNGVRIVVFGGGHTWYVNSNWQKAPVGPNGADVINLTLEQYRAILDGTTPVIPVAPTTPTYSIATLNPSIAEGGTATFSVTTTNVADGTLLNYSISGDVNAADIMGPLQGTVRINASGSGVISVITASDVILEGPEILRVRLDINGATRDTVINDGAASPPTNRTLMESNGTVSLYRNSDGTFSAVEGGSSTLIKDYGNPPTPTMISNIVAADYLNGVRIVVFSGGHTWYVDSNWQKAPVGPNGADVINLTTEQYAAILSGGTPVGSTYVITPTSPTINEGGTATFNVTTTNVADGTLLYYRLTGVIDGGDVIGGMEGSFRVNAGRGVINIPIVADLRSEGPEAFTVSILVNGPSPASAGMIINDATLATPSLIESNGTVSLFRNSDGTFSAQEGSNSTLIKDYGNPPTPTRITDIFAAEYFNGHRIVVFGNGHSWYVDSNWQKAPVGPNGADVINLTPAQFATVTGGTLAPPVIAPPILIRSLIESNGTVSLHRNADGTFTATEGGVSTFVKDYGYPATPTKISNMVAADYYNGNRIVVFAGGHAWYVDSNWQKAAVGPNGADTINLNAQQLALVLGGGTITPTPPTTILRSLLEGNGTVSLYGDNRGTFSAYENGTYTFIKDYGNPATPTYISNIIAADYYNGHRVVVFAGGHAWYVDSNWQKAPVGPNGADVINFSPVQLAAFLGGANYVAPPPVMRSIVESTGAVTLHRNSDGTFSASENGTLIAIKDAGQPIPTKISNIVAADFYNGHRVVVFGGGHAWYVDSNWQKAPVGPSGADTINLSPAQVAALIGTAVAVDNTPSYSISPSAASVQEGQTANFNLVTTNVAPGTVVNYALMGIAMSDIVGGRLAGSVTTDASGSATISIPTAIDPAFGNKLLSISLSVSGNVVSRSMVISDQGGGTVASAPVVDKIMIAKPSSEFSLNVTGSSAQLVSTDNTGVTKTLNNIDRLEFTDVKLALDTAPTESAGQTALLLGAVLPGSLALDASKQALLGTVINLFDQGFSMKELSGAVLRLPIWDILTGKAAPTKADVATYLINNVYGAPDAATLQAGIAAMSNEASQGEFLASLAQSTSGQSHIGLTGIQTTGLVYL
jgi:uncharacterized phosphosugar-binding protein